MGVSRVLRLPLGSRIISCERFALSLATEPMIVCCCNAIREDTVRNAARTGACTVGQAYGRAGCKVKCGSCLPFARAIIAEEQAVMAANPQAAAA
jgi:bacterioferritin-associated ferredoxin